MKVDPSTYPPPPPPPKRAVLVPLEAQIACVRREISFRERVYPRLVGTSRMTPQKAKAELEDMRAVLATLEELASGRMLF